jgi:AcrR family transcriptional regulator
VKKTSKKIRQSPKLPAQKRREQLLWSAKALFLKKGYRSTTTEDIAAKAGLTKGAVYFHFANKEDIFLELMKRLSEEHHATLLRELSVPMSPVEFFTYLVDYHGRKGCGDFDDMADLWVQAVRVPRIRRHMSRQMKIFHEHACRALDTTSSRGRGCAPDIIVFITSLYHGLAVQKMISPSQVNLDRQMSLLASLFDKKGTGRKRK